MPRTGGRRRLVFVAAATVLTALSAFAAFRAQDAGAAWTTVLMGGRRSASPSS
jgi:hypothetical protein